MPKFNTLEIRDFGVVLMEKMGKNCEYSQNKLSRDDSFWGQH